MSARWLAPLMLGLTLLSPGCVKKAAVNALANTLSGETGGSFTQDDDLQFVGDAIPFAIKLMESVADQAPDHQPIRATLCASFTQYAVVYIKWPADQQRYRDFATYEAGQARAKKMLQRARGYCMAAWDLEHPGFSAQIHDDTEAALARATVDDVSLLYWTGASWLAEISMSKEDMDAIGALPIAADIVRRGLALDEAWGKGSFHDLMIQLEPSLPMPGGLDRARTHYERELALAGGTLAGPHVSLATSVSITTQNREEFEDLMMKALAVDASKSPEDQLANLYAQEQARFYLDHVDDLFLE